MVAAAATDILLNPAFQSLQNQIEGVSAQQNQNVLLGALEHSDTTMNGEFRRLNQAIDTAALSAAGQNFTTLSSINGLGRDIVASQTQALINNLQNFNQLQSATQVGFSNSLMSQVTSTNQIIAQGTANAAAVASGFCELSKEMAACCCDVKGLIVSDGNATRQLINDTNVQTLRDQLAAANNQVSNNNQNQYLLSTILAHLHPVTGSTIV
ncbi:MAG: hypothetical protein ACOH2V_00755 [Candidatus Saccharimonadaceae bacterium]